MGYFNATDKTLCEVFIACTKGEAKNFVCNPERSGHKAWKQMVSHFDPRTLADRSVAYARGRQCRLTSARHKTPQSARNTVHTWKTKRAQFEPKSVKKVDEYVKILALK